MSEPGSKVKSSKVSDSKVRPVAISLIVASAVYVLFLLSGIAVFSLRLGTAGEDRGFVLSMILNCTIPVVFNAMLICGATCMYRRTSYMWSYATCCLAMFPMCGPMYVIGIPLGIWGLVVLRKPEVRDSFQYM